MVAEYPIFDLWHLFVETIFGNFILAILGLAVIYAVLCGMFKMSIFLIMTIVGSFLFIMLTGFFGSIFAILMSFFALTYFAYNFVKWIQGNIAS